MTPGRGTSEVLSPHPVVAFIGPFGTGKTEIAISYSFAALGAGRETCLVDLDVVTPYFRVGDYRETLAREGLRVIAAPGALASFETPALPPEIGEAIEQREIHTVLDVGGDVTGARLLGTYAERIAADEYDLLMAANPFRPDPSGRGLAGQRRLIEEMTGLRVTGLIANPHVGGFTEREHLESGWEEVSAAAEGLGLRVAFFAAAEELVGSVPEVGVPVLPMRLRVRLPWEAGSHGAGGK
jgi:hypothetical protein